MWPQSIIVICNGSPFKSYILGQTTIDESSGVCLVVSTITGGQMFLIVIDDNTEQLLTSLTVTEYVPAAKADKLAVVAPLDQM